MYLLDAYNLVHAGRNMGGAFAALTLRTLCQWIMANPKRQKTTLVIDGRPKPDEPSPNEFPELNFVYSGAGITADHVIAQTIDRSKNRKNITVVTNDRAVATHARMHHASPLPCEAFLNLLLTAGRGAESGPRNAAAARKASGTVSPGETEHWLKEFDLQSATPPPPPPQARADDPLGDLDIDTLLGPTDPT